MALHPRPLRITLAAVGLLAGSLLATQQANGSESSAAETTLGNLNAVEAISPTDVWAVGSRNGRVLVEHYDGTAWTRQSAPGAGTLSGIAVVAADDIWAVGTSTAGPLLEHYDGQQWTKVSSATPTGELLGVAAVSSADVWAVGKQGIDNTLIEHWDGTVWSQVSDPNQIWESRSLYSVSAVGPDDVWAAGQGYTDEEGGILTLTEHYNGKRWSVVHTPENPNGGDRTFSAIAAASADDVWAVGDQRTSFASYATLADHWSGTRWKIIDTPKAGVENGSHLAGVGVDSTSDVWAVGNLYNGGWIKVLILHWDGAAWSRVHAPGPGLRHGAYLTAVSADAPDDAWAVGKFRDRFGDHVLIEHWDGTSWTE